MRRIRDYWDTVPREITARYTSKCHETGRTIEKGEPCIYYPKDRKVFSMDSKQAESYRSVRFDEIMLGIEY